MPRPLPSNAFDPRRRYHAIAKLLRAPETDYERALDTLLKEEDPAVDLDEGILRAVTQAYGSFQVPRVRALFDASLLGRGTPAELKEAFGVSEEETAAYAHLFFDRSVFPNDFHIIAFIGQGTDKETEALLKEAYTKGFRSLRFRYASETSPPTPDVTLQRIFEADAQHYMRHRETPLTAKAVKEVRALGKHVISTAQALDRKSVV